MYVHLHPAHRTYTAHLPFLSHGWWESVGLRVWRPGFKFKLTLHVQGKKTHKLIQTQFPHLWSEEAVNAHLALERSEKTSVEAPGKCWKAAPWISLSPHSDSAHVKACDTRGPHILLQTSSLWRTPSGSLPCLWFWKRLPESWPVHECVM